jgi:diguanylate cyclase (GGDEF)-like protein
MGVLLFIVADGAGLAIAWRLFGGIQAHQKALAVSLEERTEALQILSLRTGELEAALELQSITDTLTGLFNRRHFMAVVEQQVSAAHRQKAPLSLLYLDVDHFKLVNDEYGHPVGDAVLQELARRAGPCFRTEDVFSRIGGEEFAALLPNAALDDAILVAERVRRSMASSPVAAGGTVLVVTVSVGAASLKFGDTPARLLKRADDALYQAKRAGRNRVVVEDGRTT